VQDAKGAIVIALPRHEVIDAVVTVWVSGMGRFLVEGSVFFQEKEPSADERYAYASSYEATYMPMTKKFVLQLSGKIIPRFDETTGEVRLWIADKPTEPAGIGQIEFDPVTALEKEVKRLKEEIATLRKDKP
jgi:hypothetical protein